MRRPSIMLILAMILLSATPDAMVVPVLRGLMIDRYGVSVGSAHLFMTINLVGGIIAVAFMSRLQRKAGHARTVVIAAMANAVLLAIMALPIGFAATLTLRFFEGAADLFVYAFLFDAISKLGPAKTRPRRLAAAGTALMIGVATGLGLGGVIGSKDPTLTLWAGSIACLIAALPARRALKGIAHTREIAYTRAPLMTRAKFRALSPVLCMMFADRALSGLLVTTVPLYLSLTGADPRTSGGLIGIAMLLMALCTWPAGRLVERVGPFRVRAIACALYAGGIGVIPAITSNGFASSIAVFAIIGIAGAGIFAASLLLVGRSGTDAPGMGAFHAAGNLGFLVGPTVAGIMLSVSGGANPSAEAYTLTLAGLALTYIVITQGALLLTRSPSESPVPGSVHNAGRSLAGFRT